MNEYNLAFTYSSYKLIDENDNHLGEFTTRKIITYDSMLKTCSVGCLTAIYDTKKLGKIYMVNVAHEDYTLWLKILKKVDYAMGIMEPLASYRILQNSVSRNKIKSAVWQWKIYREVENLNLLKSFYYFVCYALNSINKY